MCVHEEADVEQDQSYAQMVTGFAIGIAVLVGVIVVSLLV